MPRVTEFSVILFAIDGSEIVRMGETSRTAAIAKAKYFLSHKWLIDAQTANDNRDRVEVQSVLGGIDWIGNVFEGDTVPQKGGR